LTILRVLQDAQHGQRALGRAQISPLSSPPWYHQWKGTVAVPLTGQAPYLKLLEFGRKCKKQKMFRLTGLDIEKAGRVDELLTKLIYSTKK